MNPKSMRHKNPERMWLALVVCLEHREWLRARLAGAPEHAAHFIKVSQFNETAIAGYRNDLALLGKMP
jgi:hypothetical protein